MPTRMHLLASIFAIVAASGCLSGDASEPAGVKSPTDIALDGWTVTGGEPFYFTWNGTDAPTRWFAMNFTVSYDGAAPAHLYDTFGDVLLVDSAGQQQGSWDAVRWNDGKTSSPKFAPGTSATVTMYWPTSEVAPGIAETWWKEQALTHDLTEVPVSAWTYP